MKCLSIDATGAELVVCACNGDRRAARIGDSDAHRHNSRILEYVDEVMQELDMRVQDVDVLGCVVGAGSFTGIRLGVSTVNGLALACAKPCVAVTSMQLIAYPVKDSRFITAIDARHDNYYGAEFAGDWQHMTHMGNYIGAQLRAETCPVYYRQGATDPDALLDITMALYEQGNTTTLEPLYLKKSQAEREKDGDDLA